MSAPTRSKTVAQPTRLPTRKMAASGTVGLVAFAVATAGEMLGWPVPEEAAFSVAAALMWAAGYVTREKRPPANGLGEKQLERLAVHADYPDDPPADVEPRRPRGGGASGGGG